MTEEERRRFESLETLRAAQYASFNDRRGQEWKLSVSIWTALALILVGLVQPAKQAEVFPLRGRYVWVFFAAAGSLIVILHAVWSDWASRANSIDRAVLLHFREEMVNNLVKLPFSPDLDKRIKQHPSALGWRQRSHLIQISITALLAIASVLIVYVRSS